MARREISEEIKQQVLAELLLGKPVNATARKYALSPATVSRLRAEISSERMKQIETEKGDRIDDLLLICVAANINGMKQIAEFTCQPDYLKTQDVDAIAALYKEMSVTTLSILEAASAVRDSPDSEETFGQ